MAERIDHHRVFGMVWMDFFYSTAIRVETEIDVARQLQLLDVALHCATPDDLPAHPLPDGFAHDAPYTLMTFKSYWDTLDLDVIDELTSHLVGYRKMLGGQHPAASFRLIAVSARRPTELMPHLQRVSHGVYDLEMRNRRIRVIVIAELPRTPNNAMLHMFSANTELLHYARQTYRPHFTQTSQMVFDLFGNFRAEGVPVPTSIDEYLREAEERVIRKATVEARLEGLTPEQRLQGLTPEQCMQNFTPEQRLQNLTLEQRLQGLTPEECAEFQRLLNQNPPPAPR
jgi:hypothetical protein